MTIGFSLTHSCNFQCKHCLVESTLEHQIANNDVINKFYEIVRYSKPDTVCIVGGEPLLFIEKVIEIVNNVKEYCNNIIIFSNGTFLLDPHKREIVKNLKVQVRISKTIFHKNFWNDEMEKLIDDSPYWIIEGLKNEIVIFPKGRALKNGVYNNYECPCSLVNQEYDGNYYNNRILIMQDGSVNMWCPCLPLELANIFNDEIITHELLVNREKEFRKFLLDNNLLRTDMLYMCNKICGNFRVSKEGIYFKNILVKNF